GDETHFREMPTRDAFVAAGSWIVGDVSVCLAPDADRILAFDLSSGRLLWSRPRKDTIQVIPDTSGSVLLVAEAGVTSLSVRTGTPEWFTAIRRPVGRAIVDGPQLVIPISDNRFEFLRISDGTRILGDAAEVSDDAVTVSLHPPASLQPVHLRNLHRSSDVVISQSATSLERIVPTAATEPERSEVTSRLESLLIPVADWRANTAPLVGALRKIDGRIRLADGLLVHLRSEEHTSE